MSAPPCVRGLQDFHRFRIVRGGVVELQKTINVIAASVMPDTASVVDLDEWARLTSPNDSGNTRSK